MKQNKANFLKKDHESVHNKVATIWRTLHHLLVKQHWLSSRWGIGLLIVLITLVFSYPSSVGIRAAESHVYPTYCLGGWQNPQNAGGQPNLEMQAPAGDFNSDNSAILKDALADMFCGYFQGETHDNPPSRAVLMFSWQIDSAEKIEPAPEVIPVPVETLPAIDTPPIDKSPTQEPANSSDSQVPATSDDRNLGSPVQAQFVHSVDSVQLAVNDESVESVPAKEIQPEPMPAPDPVGIEPGPEPMPEVIPEPTVIEPIPVPIIESPDETSGFLEAQYSFDGLNWKSLGIVNMGNWRSFQPEIPINTWEDIGKLQVVLSARSTFDEQPTVRLDGMWLETQYNPTWSEAIQDLSDQTNELLSDLVDTTGNSLTTLNDVLTPGEQQAEAIKVEPSPEVNQPADDQTVLPTEVITPPPPALIAKRHLLFSVTDTIIPTTNIVPWYTRDDLKVLQLDEKNIVSFTQSPNIETSESGKSMIVSGSCSSEHFVILLYRNPDDYKQNPGAYAVNVAKKCVGGQFQFDLINIPDTLSVGTYYLLVGAQGLEGPWRPASALVSVTIGSKIEEEQQ